MGTLNRIIAAVDNSKIADEVLKRALLFAKNEDSVVTIVHTIDVPWFDTPNFFGGTKIKETDETQIKKKIEQKVQKLNKDTNVKCIVLINKGDAPDRITHIAKQENAQIIILGAHSKEDIKTKKFGSTAQKVTQESHIPVLVVKNKANESYKNILVPTDVSEFSQESILFTKKIVNKESIELAYLYQYTNSYDIDFYNLSPIDEELINERVKFHATEHLKKFKKSVDIDKGELIESSTSIDNDLINLIIKNNNDLVLIGSHGTKNIISFLFGSTASFLMKESTSDILVYVP